MPGQELDVRRAGQRERQHRRDAHRDVGRAVLRVQPPERARDLAVGGERVGDPREADHRAVGGLQQHDRAEPADRVAQQVPEPRRVEGRDHAEQRRRHEVPAERRVPVHGRHGHRRHRRHPHQDHEHRDAREHHEVAQPAPPHPHVRREPRRRLDARGGHAGQHHREQEVVPVGGRAEVDRVDHLVRVELLRQPEDHDHDAQREERQADPQRRARPPHRDAAHVRPAHPRHRDGGDHDLGGPVPGRRPRTRRGSARSRRSRSPSRSGSRG